MTDINKKARRTHSAQTRDMLLGSRVTSQSDMKVTPQRRKYMRSSLQRSCYMDRHSGEGGSNSIFNPLALTYHFGQASATTDRKRAADITGHPPHPTVKHHVVNIEGRDVPPFYIYHVVFDGRVTSQSDIKVTPHRRKYMRSSLQRSCYVERHSGEGGSTSIFNPLALTYHFGRPFSTSVRREPPR